MMTTLQGVDHGSVDIGSGSSSMMASSFSANATVYKPLSSFFICVAQ